MYILSEKQTLIQWVKRIYKEKTLEEILCFKEKNEITLFENQLIQKGLNDVLAGNVSSHDEVLKKFKVKFEKN